MDRKTLLHISKVTSGDEQEEACVSAQCRQRTGAVEESTHVIFI